MELRFTKVEIAFRDEVRSFCEANLPQDIRRRYMLGQRPSKQDIVTWQRILNKKGWAAPLWPREHGGPGWDAVRYFIFKEECWRAWAPDVLNGNINLAGPVIIAYGTDEQKAYFLPRLLNLDLWFCQGFSETEAGSDLASLKTRAVREGDEYIINGQKIWTTSAHHADWMFGLFRTDPNAKKQKGISYILVDMKTPGIKVRPIITMDGHHHVNEVFFDNVKVPVKNLIGEENKGWDYAKFQLGNERISIARIGLSRAKVALAKALAARIVVDGRPMSEDPRFREKMAAVEVELKALEITNMMVVAGVRMQAGQGSDPRTSVLKLKGSELQHTTNEILMEIAGPHCMARQVAFLEGHASEVIGPEWAATSAPNHYIARAATIYGGSSEVQKNIVAKSVLGL